MSEHTTMQFGTLELRRTEEGWQYLSEGVGHEPDAWHDAASVLGPFGGSGVNDLLDELAAVKVSAAAREQELVEVLKHIRGKSNCCDAWDDIDEVVPYDHALYS
jgi:hypothetical protein